MTKKQKTLLQENLTECLKSLDKYPEIKEKLDEAGVSATFEKELKEYAHGIIQENELQEIVKAISEGEVSHLEFSNADLFQECQTKARSLVADWNEQAATYALSAYVLQEGEVGLRTEAEEGKDENAYVSLGVLFNLSDEDKLRDKEAKLTTAQRKKLPDSVFCGPNRSFPVHDRAHALAALRLLNRAKLSDSQKAKVRACIVRKAKKFGVGPGAKNKDGENCGIAILPIMIGVTEETWLYPITVETKEEYQALLEGMEAIAKTYWFDEDQKQAFEAFVKSFEENVDIIFSSDEDFDPSPLFVEDTSEQKEGDEEEKEEATIEGVLPLELDVSFLAQFFMKTEWESDIREYLLPLVAIKRQLGLEDENIRKMTEPYEVFATSVLADFYRKQPPKKEDAGEESGENASVEHDPSAEGQEGASLDEVTCPVGEPQDESPKRRDTGMRRRASLLVRPRKS